MCSDNSTDGELPNHKRLPGKLYGVGIGPGDPELLTVKAARLLRECAQVITPKARKDSHSVARGIVQRYLGPDATVHEIVFPMCADTKSLSTHWSQAAGTVQSLLEPGSNVVFCTLGDPLLYSTYIYLLRALRERMPELRVETVPGVNAFSAVAALTETPLGEGKGALIVIPTADDLAPVEQALRQPATVVLMKVGARLQPILELLRRHERLAAGVFVARAGHPDQRVVYDLRSLLGADARSGYLSTMILYPAEGTAT